MLCGPLAPLPVADAQGAWGCMRPGDHKEQHQLEETLPRPHHADTPPPTPGASPLVPQSGHSPSFSPSFASQGAPPRDEGPVLGTGITQTQCGRVAGR